MKIIWNEHSVKLHRNIQKIVKSLVCVNFNNFYELRTGEKSSELNLCCFFADPFVCVFWAISNDRFHSEPHMCASWSLATRSSIYYLPGSFHSEWFVMEHKPASKMAVESSFVRILCGIERMKPKSVVRKRKKWVENGKWQRKIRLILFYFCCCSCQNDALTVWWGQQATSNRNEKEPMFETKDDAFDERKLKKGKV